LSMSWYAIRVINIFCVSCANMSLRVGVLHPQYLRVGCIFCQHFPDFDGVSFPTTVN
jgi:hypothetical protein